MSKLYQNNRTSRISPERDYQSNRGSSIEKKIINQMKQSDEGLFKPDSSESKLDIIDTMLDGAVRAGSFGMIDLPIIRKSVKKYFDENPKHYESFSKSMDMMRFNPLLPYYMIDGMKSLFNKVMANINGKKN